MPDQKNYAHRLRKPTWTHIALCVKDIDASIAWYERHTHLTLLSQGQDANGRNAWIGDSSQVNTPFVLVLGQFYEGKDPFAPAKHLPLGPFAHIGIEYAETIDIGPTVKTTLRDTIQFARRKIIAE